MLPIAISTARYFDRLRAVQRLILGFFIAVFAALLNLSCWLLMQALCSCFDDLSPASSATDTKREVKIGDFRIGSGPMVPRPRLLDRGCQDLMSRHFPPINPKKFNLWS